MPALLVIKNLMPAIDYTGELQRADEVGAGYQTYMHKLLRDIVMEKDSIERRLEKLEKALRSKAG